MIIMQRYTYKTEHKPKLKIGNETYKLSSRLMKAALDDRLIA